MENEEKRTLLVVKVAAYNRPDLDAKRTYEIDLSQWPIPTHITLDGESHPIAVVEGGLILALLESFRRRIYEAAKLEPLHPWSEPRGDEPEPIPPTTQEEVPSEEPSEPEGMTDAERIQILRQELVAVGNSLADLSAMVLEVVPNVPGACQDCRKMAETFLHRFKRAFFSAMPGPLRDEVIDACGMRPYRHD